MSGASDTLHEIREALQIYANGEAAIDVYGQRAGKSCAGEHVAVFKQLGVDGRPILPQAVEAAGQLALGINRTHGELINMAWTLRNHLWIQYRFIYACASLGKVMTTAFDQAVLNGIVQPERVDAKEFATQFVAESLAISAIMSTLDQRTHAPVYINPYAVGELRAGHPDISRGYFGMIIEAGCRTTRLLPEYFTYIKQHKISSRDFSWRYTYIRDKLLDKERAWLNRTMLESWPSQSC